MRRTRSGNAQKLEKPSFINDKVLRQTEEANLIVASSYNAVVKWSLNNSLNPMKMQNSASVYAGLAQLGERFSYKEDVRGSIPLTRTIWL